MKKFIYSKLVLEDLSSLIILIICVFLTLVSMFLSLVSNANDVNNAFFWSTLFVLPTINLFTLTSNENRTIESIYTINLSKKSYGTYLFVLYLIKSLIFYCILMFFSIQLLPFFQIAFLFLGSMTFSGFIFCLCYYLHNKSSNLRSNIASFPLILMLVGMFIGPSCFNVAHIILENPIISMLIILAGLFCFKKLIVYLVVNEETNYI